MQWRACCHSEASFPRTAAQHHRDADYFLPLPDAFNVLAHICLRRVQFSSLAAKKGLAEARKPNQRALHRVLLSGEDQRRRAREVRC